MSSRVTIADIAVAAKVHPSTVSRALRNDLRLLPATLNRVQKIAKKLGYVPDPVLSSLIAYRLAARPTTDHGTLAWVTGGPTPDWWTSIEIYQFFYKGAKARAEKFGYNLEPFWLHESGMTVKRASSVLRARNIPGLISAPQFETCDDLDLDWPRFSVVTIGDTLISPQLHTVAPNTFRAAKTILRKIKAYGYDRVGLAVSARLDDRIDHAWSGGFLAEQLKFYPDAPIPPFFIQEPVVPEVASSFWKWYEKYRPQAIITSGGYMWEFMKKRDWKSPRDIALAYLNLPDYSQKESGILEMPLEVGAAAIDMLIGLIQRNEKGIPEFPKRLLVEGVWKDGATLPNLLASKR